MTRPTVAPEIKAAALADLLAGEQPAVVAQRYGLNRQTVKAWRARAQPDTQPALQPVSQPIRRPAIEEQQATLTDLVLQNLRAKLIATQRIAEHATQPEWLNKQSAADVAALFERLDRSAVNILDRMAGAHPAATTDSGVASGSAPVDDVAP